MTLSFLKRLPRSKAKASPFATWPNVWETIDGHIGQVFPWHVQPGARQRYGWRVKAKNGEQVDGSGGQGYTRPRSARRAAWRIYPPAS